MTMPRNVARFEQLIYASLVVRLITAVVDFGRLSAVASPLSIIAAAVAGFAVIALLAWLIARRGKNWARWVLLALFLLGLPFVILGPFVTEVGGLALARPSFFVISLIALETIAQAAALIFVFTSDAKPWFARGVAVDRPPAAEMPRVRVPAGRREVVAPGELDHSATVDAYIAEMAALGVGTYTAAPPFFRLLWGMGLRIPPPMFMGYVPLTLITGGIFAVLWGLGMWLIAWRTQSGMPAWLAIVVSLLAGLLFGLGMASYYRSRSRKLPLPSWQNYLPPR